MRISKTNFLAFVEEPIHFWASIHGELTSRHFDEFQQHLATQGQSTERLALKYLHEIILPLYDDAELIWQADFTHGPFYVRLDGLVYDKLTDTYDIYEIKASTSPEKYLHDIAFQRLVCEPNISVNRAFILHLNKAYTRQGDIDLSELFTVTQMDVQINDIRSNLKRALASVVRVAKMPDATTLSSCTKPQNCPCSHLCHPKLPAHSIYDIPRLNKKKIRYLQKKGILAIDDIPNDFELSEKQQSVVNVVRSGEPFIDREAIRAKLDEIKYPLAFLDYEAAITAIPEYDGYSPNQNMAFQYSLHVIEEDDGETEHYEFLASGHGDPACDLIEHLATYMPESGSIVVWNRTYEAGINESLADLYPAYRDFALGLNDRLYDLMLIFKDDLYLHPDFHGSASIKKVLPILVPTMTYDDMVVGHGGQAVHAWSQLVSNEMQPNQITQLRSDMLKYCKQDTLAMVEIWKVLCTQCEV